MITPIDPGTGLGLGTPISRRQENGVVMPDYRKIRSDLWYTAAPKASVSCGLLFCVAAWSQRIARNNSFCTGVLPLLCEHDGYTQQEI